jgi:hypothetical protein
MEATHAPYMVSDANVVKKDKKPSPMDSRHRLLKLILKLAFVNGYDDNNHLIGDNGQVIANSDIGSLISHALSHGKVLVGEHEFIQLLKRAKVDPELILNQNVKLKLMNAASPPAVNPVADSEIRVSSQEPIDVETYETVNRVSKRRRDDDIQPSEANEVNPKRGKWQIKSTEFPKMMLKKSNHKRRWVVPPPSRNSNKTEWVIPASDYPKASPKVVNNASNDKLNIDDDFSKWRNAQYEKYENNSDADSEPQEIIDEPPLDGQQFKNNNFTLAQPRLSAPAST